MIVCPTRYLDVIIVEKSGVNSGLAISTYSHRLYISGNTTNENSTLDGLKSSLVFTRLTNWFTSLLSEGIRDSPILIGLPYKPADMIVLGITTTTPTAP